MSSYLLRNANKVRLIKKALDGIGNAHCKDIRFANTIYYCDEYKGIAYNSEAYFATWNTAVVEVSSNKFYIGLDLKKSVDLKVSIDDTSLPLQGDNKGNASKLILGYKSYAINKLAFFPYNRTISVSSNWMDIKGPLKYLPIICFDEILSEISSGVMQLNPRACEYLVSTISLKNDLSHDILTRDIADRWRDEWFNTLSLVLK